ncbi:MAG TPA: 50S ribosomal protein L10 [Solirubrobacterales bacterium]|nr:50S ribosomal protein L10 [Solirubrobacterales bacterium]
MNREEKSAAIKEIASEIEASEAIFAVDYRGISVPQAAELRSKLREADASFRIVKNRLTKIAADQAGEERLAELLQGPTALTFVRGDTAQAAKAITTFNKEHEVLTYKGGFMDATSLDEGAFKSIAKLPGRDVLNGQLAGVVASPLTGLVRGLGSMIQGLALQLGQIAEQGLVSGEAPAAEEAPAEEPQAEPEEAPAAEAEKAEDAPVEEAPTEAASGNEPPADQAEAPEEEPEPAAETSDQDSNEEEG